MKTSWKSGAISLAAGCVIAAAAVAETAPAAKPVSPTKAKASANLIPRATLFGNPDRAGVQISPDGKHISYLAASDGVMNVWVAPVDKPGDAKVVTSDKIRGVRNYSWAFNSANILYTQDFGGDENWNVFSTDITTNKTTNLTPLKGVAAQIAAVSEKFPDEIIVGLNDRDPKVHDLWKLNIKTGEKTLVLQNPGTIDGGVCGSIATDDNYIVRFASASPAAGGQNIYTPEKAADGSITWKLFTSIPFEDASTTNPVGFDKTGKIAYLMDSRGRNTAGLFTLNLETKEQKLLAEDSRADVGEVLAHPTEKTVQAVGFDYERNTWKILDKSIEKDFAYLKTVADGDFNITSRTLDDKTWIVTYVLDNGPVKYYRYERGDKPKATFLFTNRKSLENIALAKMHPTVIKSRDGLNLVSYLTLPITSDSDNDARPSQPLPMVLLVHGGPWARDSWGFNGTHQWLANRGYAVLSVNYRASTGFGKEFLNAGNKEWAGKMHDDLIDAVNWAVEQKIADPKRVAIMGGSYGGYATLVGLTFTPDTFACGVDIVGPSNLTTLLNTIPPYWAAGLEQMTKQVGDHRTEEGRKFLATRSPLTLVGNIKKPLLIGQGANDPRVKQAEADQIVKAMQEKNIPVTYVLYPDEGHGFARPQNRKSFNAVAEAFLAEHLGGEYEPIGKDFEGSSITTPTGAEQVPGLFETMQNKK